MNVRALVFFGFAAFIATTSPCRSGQTNEPANLSAIAPTNRPAALIDADEVFAQTGWFSQVTNAVVMAHTSDSEQAVVVGKAGEKYVAVVAYRALNLQAKPWRTQSFRWMDADRLCHWEYGKEVYYHVPTREDLGLLLKRVYSPKTIKGFIFQETAE